MRHFLNISNSADLFEHTFKYMQPSLLQFDIYTPMHQVAFYKTK